MSGAIYVKLDLTQESNLSGDISVGICNDQAALLGYIVTALAIHFIHLFSLHLFACNCLIHIVNMLVRVRKRLNPNQMCVSFADHFTHK